MTEEHQGSIIGGLALVAAAGIALSGFGEKLFSGPFTFANISGVVIILIAILIGAYLLFLLGATLYNDLLKQLSFVKYPILKAIILVAFMGLAAYILQYWIAK